MTSPIKNERLRRIAAYSVHLFTASGIIPAALAVHEMFKSECDPKRVFFYLLLTTLIDALDGPMARRLNVKRYAASIDGRTIDDLLDYLTFAFIPLMLIWKMEWLPAGTGPTVILAMGASLMGFAHVEAKDEARGMFRGFPSYWNAFAFYAGIFSTMISPWLSAIMLWSLTVLTVSPVWTIYPNLAPKLWRRSIIAGTAVWAAIMFAMLWNYPNPPVWMLVLSLVHPVYYFYASWRCRKQLA
jgi:phosphatidylcholine synthase